MAYQSNMTGAQTDEAIDIADKSLRSVNCQISGAAVGQWRKLLRMKLNVSEKTATGMLSVIARTGNDGMDYVTFNFTWMTGNLNATVIGRSANLQFSKLRVNQISNSEYWLEICLSSTDASYFNVTPMSLYNCEILQSKVFELSNTSQSSVEVSF